MTVTAVVRLMDAPLRRGEVVGWVESATNEARVPVRNREELLDALTSLAPADADGETGPIRSEGAASAAAGPPAGDAPTG